MSNIIKANDVKLEELSLEVPEDFEPIDESIREEKEFGGKR